MTYVIHLDWESFLAQADLTAIGDEPIYLQDYAETRIVHGLPRTVSSALLVAYADVGGTVHAARLLVETLSLLRGERKALHQAMRERTALAHQIVHDVLSAKFPGAVQPGLLLVPGLREDLKHFETDHDLWRWENREDPIARRLVARRDGAEAKR